MKSLTRNLRQDCTQSAAQVETEILYYETIARMCHPDFLSADDYS